MLPPTESSHGWILADVLADAEKKKQFLDKDGNWPVATLVASVLETDLAAKLIVTTQVPLLAPRA